MAGSQKPTTFVSEGRQIELREIHDLTLVEDGRQPVRVVVSDERWVQVERIAGKTVRTPRQSHWRWIVTPELHGYPARAIWAAGHRRWGIENHAFNELTQHYHLTHCPHHHPVAIVAWLLILVLGFNLFELFARVHGKLCRQGGWTLKAIASQMDRALEHPDELEPLWSG